MDFPSLKDQQLQLWSIYVKTVYHVYTTLYQGHCWDLKPLMACTLQIYNLPFWEQILLCRVFMVFGWSIVVKLLLGWQNKVLITLGYDIFTYIWDAGDHNRFDSSQYGVVSPTKIASISDFQWITFCPRRELQPTSLKDFASPGKMSLHLYIHTPNDTIPAWTFGILRSSILQ